MNVALAAKRPGAHVNALDAQWIVWRLREDVVSGVAAAVLVYLAARCHGDGWTTVRLQEIASAVKWDRRTVSAVINALARCGLLEVHHNTGRSADGKIFHEESDYRLPIEHLLLQPVSAIYGGEPVPRRKKKSRAAKASSEPTNEASNKPSGEISSGPLAEASSEPADEPSGEPSAEAPGEPSGVGVCLPHDPGSRPHDPAADPHDSKSRPHDRGSSFGKIREETEEEEKGRAAPPGEGEGVSLESQAHERWRQAYASKYKAPPIERDGDRKHVKALVRAARTQAEAHRARCEARGETTASVDELASACVERWMDAYLANPGRPPAHFFAKLCHPLARLADDLEQYGTPWAAEEKRKADALAKQEQQRREAEANERRAAEDRERRERSRRFHERQNERAARQLPAHSLPAAAHQAPAQPAEPVASAEPAAPVEPVEPAEVEPVESVESASTEAPATCSPTVPACAPEGHAESHPENPPESHPAASEPGLALAAGAEPEEPQQTGREARQRQLARLFPQTLCEDTPDDIQRLLRESGLAPPPALPALPALQATRASAQEAKRAAACARHQAESRELAVFLPQTEGIELLALLDRPRRSLDLEASKRMNRLMARAIQAREQQEASG